METLGAADFDGTRLKRPGSWAVLFLANWCPFCRSFRPLFERFDGAGAFRMAVADVTDEGSPLWNRFRIEVVPTLLAFRDGAILHRIDGIPMEGLAASDLEDLRGFLTNGGTRPATSDRAA